MANMAAVNKAIKSRFPHLDIEVVRGDGYVYFDGADGFDKIESIMTHPVCVTTANLARMVIEEIERGVS
jgi:hypothetical protein